MYSNYKIEMNSGFKEHEAHMVKTQHYSKSLARGCGRVYSLFVDDKLAGVAAFGVPVGRLCQSKYSKTGKKVLELKRLVLDPVCAPNTGSWFISKLMKDLKATKLFDSVLSYADPSSPRRHTGIVYRASNFLYLGVQKYQGTKSVFYKGKRHHLRSVYNKNTIVGKILREALASGKAKVKQTEKKHVYIYRLETV